MFKIQNKIEFVLIILIGLSSLLLIVKIATNEGNNTSMLIDAFWYAFIIITLFMFSRIVVVKENTIIRLEEEIIIQAQASLDREKKLKKKIEALEEREHFTIQLARKKNSLLKNLGQQLSKKETVKEIGEVLLQELFRNFEIGTAIFYWKEKKSDEYKALHTIGLKEETVNFTFKNGNGFCGECTKNQIPIKLTDIPVDYFVVNSTLGESSPSFIYFLPIVKNNETLGLVELSSFVDIEIEKSWEKINSEIISIKKI